MASVQCYKPAEQQPCYQQQQHQSFGQKVTQVVTSVFKKDQAHQVHQAHATNQCHTSTTTNNGHFPKAATTNGTHTHETQCHGNGKTRRTRNKKRGLIEKMKDGISGHSSDSSSSSESDSDDDKKCARNKN